MAPSLAINLNPQAPALHVGRAVPLVFLLSLIGVMLVAYGFIRLCQSFHHAGSVYAFIGVTVGPRAGFVAGWTLFGTYLAYTATSVAAFGLFIQQFCIDTGIWKGASWVLVLVRRLRGDLGARRQRGPVQHPHPGHDRDDHGDADPIVTITIFAKLIGGSRSQRTVLHHERLHAAARGRLLRAVLLADVRVPVVRRIRGSVDDGRGDGQSDEGDSACDLRLRGRSPDCSTSSSAWPRRWGSAPTPPASRRSRRRGTSSATCRGHT